MHTYHDQMSPKAAVDALARLFAPDALIRWPYTGDEVPEGSSNDHIAWVRTPEHVVDRAISWWTSTSGSDRATSTSGSSTGDPLRGLL